MDLEGFEVIPHEAQFGVSRVSPRLLSVTQSQYGFSAFTDGYYFNVVRSLPITSGHGGYHDFGPGYFNPSYTMELARAGDFWKPCGYLPTWYGNTKPDEFRLEQGSAVELRVVGGKLVVEPHRPPQYRLEDLLKKVSKRNLHAEITTGRPVGKEAL